MRAVVDRETGVLMFVELRTGGALASRTLVTLFREVGHPQPQRSYLLDLGAGDVKIFDMGFRETDLDGVAAAVGDEPLVPRAVPDGYTLDRVLVSP